MQRRRQRQRQRIQQGKKAHLVEDSDNNDMVEIVEIG